MQQYFIKGKSADIQVSWAMLRRVKAEVKHKFYWHYYVSEMFLGMRPLNYRAWLLNLPYTLTNH